MVGTDITAEKSREVRLGIVMYGGVSLAIYIYGVAHELFRAVRGRGIYRFIKALTDSDIVVDVISGTSAGGINGIMLSYALCNNRDFSHASTLWREHGDIRCLLRSPYTPPEECASLLDSEGFYQPRLEEAFRNMGDYIPEPDEDPSVFNELDLFVTGTDVDGTISTRLDDAGHPVTIKDHRSVFLLKHRNGRKEPFSPGEYNGNAEVLYKSLAKLSRITSCFPAAFEPVFVQNDDPNSTSTDGLLQLWGNLGKEACFLDGGVLDNKPFTYTIGAIFSRSAERAVDRKLLYIEPDPEVFEQTTKATRPNIVQAVLSSLIGIPGYESISEDLKLISDRNSKLQQYQRLVTELHEKNIRGEQIAANETLYKRCRLVFISDRVIDGLFKKGGVAMEISPENRERASELVRTFDQLTGSLDPHQLFENLDIYFPLRRLHRMAYFLHDLLEDEHGSNDPLVKRRRELRTALNRQIKLYEIIRNAMETLLDLAPFPWEKLGAEQIWQTVEAVLYSLLDDSPGNPVAACITDADFDKLKKGETGEWLSQKQLTQLNLALKKRIAALSKAIENGEMPASGGISIIRRFETYEVNLIRHFVPPNDTVRQAYHNFKELDAVLFPLELAGDLHEKDIIQTVRISPRDAQKGFSRNGYNDKVSGDSVYHFGAFFKRSWRSNDILWGRLDATCQLTELLLEKDRIAQLVSTPACREQLYNRFFGENNSSLDPAVLFPHAGAPTQARIRQWLHDLLSPAEDRRAKALEQTTFDSILNLLISSEQHELINSELPNVITDAIVEQSQWNRFQIVEKQSANGATKQADPIQVIATTTETNGTEHLPWTFRPPKGQIDRLLASSFAALMMKDAMNSFSLTGDAPASPMDSRLGRFFRQSYRVGSETLGRDIPPLILLEIMVTALLVVRNCILNVLGSKADRIRSNLFYKIGIDYPMRIMYTLVLIAQRYPGWTAPLFLALGLISTLALAVGIVWRNELNVFSSGFSAPLILFILLPGVILLVESVILLFQYSITKPKKKAAKSKAAR